MIGPGSDKKKRKDQKLIINDEKWLEKAKTKLDMQIMKNMQN